MFKGILLTTLVMAGLQSQFYIPSDSGSSIKFKIKNLGISVTGSFTGLKGKIQFDPANLGTSSIEATVDAGTVNTGIDLRDDHLRKEEYFNVKNYPQIRFVSSKITKSNKAGDYLVTGNLRIRNVTKEISFPFTASPQSRGFLFKGEFKINRRDFKVGGNSFTLSDNLTVQLSVLAPKE